MNNMSRSDNPLVCVTGAAGFTGATAVDCLLMNGYSVLATDSPKGKFRSVLKHRAFMQKHPELYSGVSLDIATADITNINDLRNLFKDRNVIYLMHPASLFKISASRKELKKVNVEGTRKLLDTVSEYSPGLMGVTVWSSYMVYGLNRRDVSINEESSVSPCNIYAESKLEQENISLEYGKSGIPTIVIRPASVYGPRGESGIARSIRSLTWNFLLPVIPIPAEGDFISHFVNIDDVVMAALHLMKVVKSQNLSGQVFNVADDTPIRMKELVSLIASELRVKDSEVNLPEYVMKPMETIMPYGLSIPYFGLERQEIPYIFKDIVFDNRKIKSTGYQFKYPEISMGIKSTVDWYARNGRMEILWYLLNSGWRNYWADIPYHKRQFADYALIHRNARHDVDAPDALG